MKHLYYVNIRIAHEILGVADSILPHLYCQGELQNVLVISPPGRGKTTLLRELVRKVSDGNRYGRGLNVGVVDERSELAGAYLGCPQNDLGSRTDVLEGCPKAQGMFLLLRTMAPEVLAVDELGDNGDAEALRAAAVCGCRVMATVHGEDWEDVNRRFPELFTQRIFERIVLPGEPKRGKEGEYAHNRGDSDYGRQYGAWTVVPCPLYCRDTGETVPGDDFGTVNE